MCLRSINMAESQAICSASMHVVHLMAKFQLCQFDINKKEANHLLSHSERQDLQELKEIDESEDIEVGRNNKGENSEDIVEGDSMGGWVNEVELLSDKEHAKLVTAILLVKLVLTKVRGVNQDLPES